MFTTNWDSWERILSVFFNHQMGLKLRNCCVFLPPTAPLNSNFSQFPHHNSPLISHPTFRLIKAAFIHLSPSISIGGSFAPDKSTKQTETSKWFGRIKNWLAIPVGNEGPSTFTLVYWGFIPSFPTKGQLENDRVSLSLLLQRPPEVWGLRHVFGVQIPNLRRCLEV